MCRWMQTGFSIEGRILLPQDRIHLDYNRQELFPLLSDLYKNCQIAPVEAESGDYGAIL